MAPSTSPGDRHLYLRTWTMKTTDRGTCERCAKRLPEDRLLPDGRYEHQFVITPQDQIVCDPCAQELGHL